ncbi:Uncharacterised protein [Mycobacteroides abscessus subsp. abscessus]|nr:Uncharacterised protein [Mycobacteroides abscessus subsp. abscessus]
MPSALASAPSSRTRSATSSPERHVIPGASHHPGSSPPRTRSAENTRCTGSSWCSKCGIRSCTPSSPPAAPLISESRLGRIRVQVVIIVSNL